ncbi:unnamed protein product [Ectocarpus sp. 4 AP-2014]
MWLGSRLIPFFLYRYLCSYSSSSLGSSRFREGLDVSAVVDNVSAVRACVLRLVWSRRTGRYERFCRWQYCTRSKVWYDTPVARFSAHRRRVSIASRFHHSRDCLVNGMFAGPFVAVTGESLKWKKEV